MRQSLVSSCNDAFRSKDFRSFSIQPHYLHGGTFKKIVYKSCNFSCVFMCSALSCPPGNARTCACALLRLCACVCVSECVIHGVLGYGRARMAACKESRFSIYLLNIVVGRVRMAA